MMGELVGQGHASSALKHGAIAHIDVWNIDVVILKKKVAMFGVMWWDGRTDGGLFNFDTLLSCLEEEQGGASLPPLSPATP